MCAIRVLMIFKYNNSNNFMKQIMQATTERDQLRTGKQEELK